MEHNFAILSAASLSALLGAACWTDTRTRRIPNRLVLAGTLAGFALNALLPAGTGLFSTAPGGMGLTGALGGFAIALGALLPLYLLRAMGAGDVKLMAMTGAFLGPGGAAGAVVMTLLAGGMLALALAWRHGVMRSALANARAMIWLAMAGMPTDRPTELALRTTSTTLPYALAITAGTLTQILLERSGHALFS